MASERIRRQAKSKGTEALDLHGAQLVGAVADDYTGPMPEARHGFQTVPLGRHPITRFEYANATNRENHVPTLTGAPLGHVGPLTDADIASVAQQLDDDSFWILVSATPVVWNPLVAGTPVGGTTRRSIDGIAPQWTSSSTLTLSAGLARSDDDTQDIEASSPLVVNIAASGPGGLDTGSPAVNAWYASWVIADSSETNPTTGLLSLSGTAPTMPAGYDVKRLVGWHRRQASVWLRWNVFGEGRERVFFYDADRSAAPQRVVSGGSATTWATASAASVLPPVVCLAFFLAQIPVPSVGGWIRPNGHNDASGIQFLRPQASDQFQLRIADQQIQYQNQSSGGAITVDVQGFHVVV